MQRCFDLEVSAEENCYHPSILLHGHFFLPFQMVCIPDRKRNLKCSLVRQFPSGRDSRPLLAFTKKKIEKTMQLLHNKARTLPWQSFGLWVLINQHPSPPEEKDILAQTFHSLMLTIRSAMYYFWAAASCCRNMRAIFMLVILEINEPDKVVKGKLVIFTCVPY